MGSPICSAIVEMRRRIVRDPIDIREIASHLMIMISAGHDTTASAISGGMLALIRNPDQMKKLQNNKGLTESAVNEMLRYVSPTTNFVRTTVVDSQIASTRIPAGDDVCIHFCAANRDEDEFENPQDFLIERTPNRHLAFGIGAHHCLGAALARLEGRVAFEELLARVPEYALAREPGWVTSRWARSHSLIDLVLRPG